MAKVDLWEIDKEILYFLRRKIADPSARGTDTIETFDGDGSKTRFVLSNKPFHNVIAGTADGGGRDYGDGYTVDVNSSTGSATVIFGTAPDAGSSNVTIQHHHGVQGTWIFPDLPFEEIGKSQYPRIGMETVDSSMDEAALGATTTHTDMLKDIVVFAENVEQLRSIVNDVKDAVFDNKKNFYNFNLMTVVGIGPIGKTPDRRERVVSQNVTVNIPFIYET